MKDTSIQNAQSFLSDADGDVGFRYLMANSDEERASFLANETSLEVDEWETISDTVIRVRKQRLQLVEALRSAGLTKPLSMASLTSLWQTVDSVSGAEIGMNPDDRHNSEDVVYGLDGVPLPVFFNDWHIDRRMLMASRTRGEGLDTLVPSMMAREVSSTIENTLMDGWATPVDGRTLYGFTNHPDRNTFVGNNWADGTTDDQNIRDDFITAIEALENDEYDGGNYWVALHRNQYQRLRAVLDDLGTGGAATASMRERITEEFDAELGNIIVSPHVPAGEAVMFEPTPEVVQLGVAENLQPIQWSSPSGWRLHFKMFACMTLELRSDADGNMGLVHFTGLE